MAAVFQLEAAIQSAHAARISGWASDWSAIALLYETLEQLAPSPVVSLNRAAALARRDGAQAGLRKLDAINQPSLKSYQPYWALRAHLLDALGLGSEAVVAYDEAIARERDPAVIRFLAERRTATERPPR